MRFGSSSVLITGGAGFIGANLAGHLLKEGAEVTILDDFSAGSELNLQEIRDEITVVKGDIRDSACVKKAVASKDLVFHLAANASVPVSFEDPRQDFEVNAVGTLTLLEAMKEANSEARLVFASSAAVYGDQNLVAVSEKCQPRPSSPYGASKLAAEALCQTFHRVYGLQTVCLRLFNVYGPLQRKYVMFDIMRKLQKRTDELEVLGTGNQIRDFIYVSDAIEACLLSARTSSVLGEVLNVGTGIDTTIHDLVCLILKALSLHNKTKIVYTNESWKGDVERLLADVSKIAGLGFKPKTDLETGLRRFIDWYNVAYSRR